MITRDRMEMVDRNAEALGVPRSQLMESSGNAVAREVREFVDEGSRIVIVAGRGNNGGDAFVAARFLDGYDVHTMLIGSPETITTDIAKSNWEALVAAEYSVDMVRDSADFELPSCNCIVDALLGTGISGPMREPARTIAQAINESKIPVISVDAPSGMDVDTGESEGIQIEADRIVTFHDMKPGLSTVDIPVRVVDIGIPANAEILVEIGDLSPIARNPTSHKGDHGEVLVIGGGPYTGAPALAALAALRAGADLVRVACPDPIAGEIQGYSPNLIVRPFDGPFLVPGQISDVLTLARNHDVTVIGPGLGDAELTQEAVDEFLESFEGIAIVDADALRSVPNVSTHATLICTPHRGELVEMGGPQEFDWRDGAPELIDFAQQIDQVLLVKGRYDTITDGAILRANRTGNPGMTVGGTGDVLAGVSAAVAVTRDPIQAASVAAFVNGRAGDLAVAEQGYGLVATDLLDYIPMVLHPEDAS